MVAKPPERSVGKLQRNCVHPAPYTKDTHGRHCFSLDLGLNILIHHMYLHPIIIHMHSPSPEDSSCSDILTFRNNKNIGKSSIPHPL